MINNLSFKRNNEKGRIGSSKFELLHLTPVSKLLSTIKFKSFQLKQMISERLKCKDKLVQNMNQCSVAISSLGGLNVYLELKSSVYLVHTLQI